MATSPVFNTIICIRCISDLYRKGILQNVYTSGYIEIRQMSMAFLIQDDVFWFHVPSVRWIIKYVTLAAYMYIAHYLCKILWDLR